MTRVTVTEIDGAFFVTRGTGGAPDDLGVVLSIDGRWRAMLPSGTVLADTDTQDAAVSALVEHGGWPVEDHPVAEESVEVGEPPPGHPLNPVDPST